MGGDRATPRIRGHMPATIVLDNLRSAYNVGNVFRLAEATRAERIVTGGYTATPPHPKLEKTARGCDQTVDFRHVADTATGVIQLAEQGYHVYGVETVSEAQPYWSVRFHFPCALVFGNEALGVSAEALSLCASYIGLPCVGRKNSVNVANCAAVVLFAALGQWLWQ